MQETANAAFDKSRRDFFKTMAALAATTGLGFSELAHASETSTSTGWPVWAVEKSGTTIYLMGETPPRSSIWSDAHIESLLKTCGEMWTETNQIRHKNPRELVMQYGIDASKPLKERLPENEFARLSQGAALANFPLEAVANMKPWLAAFSLESAYFTSLKLEEQGTAERVLLRTAKELAIPHRSEFSSQDELIEFMGHMNEQEDLQFLQYTLDLILLGTTERERIYTAWSGGDSAPATAIVNNMKKTQPALYAKHIIARNHGWLARFEQMQKNPKPSLVIVGLYHMSGPDSLLEQLKADGWRVRMA